MRVVRSWGWLAMLVCAMAGAQQLPAGTHSADDTSRQDQVNARIAAAESAMEQQDYKGAESRLKDLAALASA